MLVLALAGCITGPTFNVTAPACQADYLPWAGGLTRYVDQGGGKGDFDLDPVGQLETRVFGEYELSSGDFVYLVSYDPEHYRTETRVEGFGYAATNGDLDTESTFEMTDVLDRGTTMMRREIRTGCDVTQTDLDAYGQEWVTTGRFIGQEFDYTRVGPLYEWSAAEFTGVWNSDLSSHEETSHSEGGVDYTESRDDDGAGFTSDDWVWDDGTDHQEGHDETDIAGTWTSHIDTGSCEIDRVIDYAGDGEGTLDCGSQGSCDLSYSNWACTWDCSDGTDGTCFASNTRFAGAAPKTHATRDIAAARALRW